MLSFPAASPGSSPPSHRLRRFPGTRLDIVPDIVCCTICGALMGVDRDGIMDVSFLPEWWRTSVLLSSDTSTAEEEVYETLVQSSVANEFETPSRTGPILRVFEGFNMRDPDPPKLYIPVHKTCLGMAKRFICSHASQKTPEPSTNGLASMWRLWQILKSRAQATHKNWNGPGALDLSPEEFWSSHPHDYYGAFWCQVPFWKEFDELRYVPNASTPTVYPEFFEADPVNIPNLPRFILSCLTPLHPDQLLPPGVESKAFASSINRLPIEIVDMILKHLRGLEDPPLACNRLLRPFLWCRALVTQDIFPWLWGMNRLIRTGRGRGHEEFPWLQYSKRPVQAVHNIDQEKGQDLDQEEGQDIDHEEEGLEIFEYMTFKLPENKWDWELLVRQWAQTDVFELGTYRQDVHLALRNRRRIWRILEEMRVDDVPIITEWPAPGSSCASAEPSERMSEPGEGASEPGESMSQLGESTFEPGENMSEPGENAFEPGESMSQLGESTSEPGENMSEPGEIAFGPGESMSQVGESTSEPGENMSEPGEIAFEPGESMSQVGESTSEPGESMSEPEESTSEPGEGTSKPGKNTSEPGESMSE